MDYSPAYISDVLRRRRDISSRFAKRVGFEQRRLYSPVKRKP